MLADGGGTDLFLGRHKDGFSGCRCFEHVTVTLPFLSLSLEYDARVASEGMLAYFFKLPDKVVYRTQPIVLCELFTTSSRQWSVPTAAALQPLTLFHNLHYFHYLCQHHTACMVLCNLCVVSLCISVEDFIQLSASFLLPYIRSSANTFVPCLSPPKHPSSICHC